MLGEFGQKQKDEIIIFSENTISNNVFFKTTKANTVHLFKYFIFISKIANTFAYWNDQTGDQPKIKTNLQIK